MYLGELDGIRSYAVLRRVRASRDGHPLSCRVRFGRLRTVVTDIARSEDDVGTAREVCEFHRELRLIRRYGDMECPTPAIGKAVGIIRERIHRIDASHRKRRRVVKCRFYYYCTSFFRSIVTL